MESTNPTDVITVNAAKKRVYLTFRGSLTKADTEGLCLAYRKAIAEVGSGFTAVSIFENFIPGTDEVQEVISRMIKMANDSGCVAAARVGQGSVFGQLQLGRLQREVKAAYPVSDCATLGEAEIYLDNVNRSDEE